MTARHNPAALTVMLAPRGEADEILALLADYAAVGSVAPFFWVDAADVGGTSIPATSVADGRVSAVVLQQVLTSHRYDRLRIAVLVPADAPGKQRVSRAAEQSLERVVRAGAVATPITLLRLLFTRGSAAEAAYDPAMVLEGWHNLLVVPEDSAGPGLGSLALDRLTDPLDVAQHVAPVVATVVGLWRGIDRVVFDDLAILPGNTLRAVRAFYRELDATDVEEQLRLQLFDSAGRLPLPRSGQTPVIYVQDVALATQTVARALWTKHRDVLRSSRMDIGAHEAQPISTWSALKIFFSFLWAALRNAPSAWLQGMLTSVSSALATTVQHAVFGRSDSAYAVVAGSDLTSWQDIGRSAEQMSSMLTELQPGGKQPIQTDLTPLWVDYANAALTLADGGRRSAGIAPVAVGAAIGVVADSADVVPSAADAFTAIPASLAAVIGVPRVAGGDVLGAADVKARLQRTFGDPAAGIEARHTFAGLTRWEAATGKSYAAQVGSILADFLDRARGEVDDLIRRIRESAKGGVDETLRRRQQVIATVTRTAGWAVFVALLVLLVIAAVAWVSWKFSLLVGGILLAIYVLAALTLFILGQRHLFAELNRRQTQMTELEGLHFNLRAALADVSRLSSAYGQLLAWNRVLGEVLRAPFGPVAPARPPRPRILDGVPRSVQIGVAAPASQEAESAAHALQQQLYGIGWLTGPWERMLESAGRQVRVESAALFRMPGAGSGSELDEWSAAVAAGEEQLHGANALWKKVQAMFDDPGSGIAGALTGGVVIPATGQQVSPTHFSGGIVQQHTGPAAPFDASLFTDTAVTAGRSVVAIDDTAVERHGLGYRAAVLQVGDGLPTYDFAMFDTVRAAVAPVDDDIPPESGSLVF